LPEFPRLSEIMRLQKDLQVFRLNESTVGKVKELIGTGDLSVFCLPYRREDALENLRWAKYYWLGRRESKPTQKVALTGTL
jgi:hypothetical protein